MTALVVWPVLVPLLGAVASLFGRGRVLLALGLGTSAATLAVAVHTALAVAERGPLRHAVGGWPAPLGIELHADGLSALMLLMAGGVGLGISVYAAACFSGEAGERTSIAFWPLWLFLWTALNGVFLSADAFNLYVTLELLTLCGIGLMVLGGSAEALRAAVRYLLAALLGSMLYLLGVALLYAAFGALDLTTLGGRMAPGAMSTAALSLTTAGLLLKTALFPLHFWLPRAHASAVTPVSAILSALVIKASFYILLRLWLVVFPEVATVAAAQAVGLLGAAAVVWGSLQAVRQHQLKLLVAYSTVSQIGYLFLVLPLIVLPGGEGEVWRQTALAGGIYHAVTHAFAKAAMFLAAGVLMHAAADGRVAALTGLAARQPMAVAAFGVAGLTTIGLPPTGGFLAKWLLLAAAVATAQWWWALLLVGGSLLTAAYVFVVVGATLTPARRRAGVAGPASGQRTLEVCCMALALVALLLGLRASEAMALLEGLL